LVFSKTIAGFGFKADGKGRLRNFAVGNAASFAGLLGEFNADLTGDGFVKQVAENFGEKFGVLFVQHFQNH
jgi:hypothetical protein